ncbi:AbrB/MazE/SpoVT family DNA-binding domain-containing protein [Ferviditalea candida]|uniref:AbrB/MazE/SpoVT family DNA-binding domain-containing protein n=1 Tax=Ferviditalea candida TaxID=3108399 RepID=A0ABU5ZJM4_9BACL|nr:AbrB/MazE/SpoVT family DNA-binding domain-containing protein [Paenibacillaceae bacterium T2]
MSSRTIGIVRELDELGRVVLPIEMRRLLGIGFGDSIEFFLGNGAIMMRKYRPLSTCLFCNRTGSAVVLFKNQFICVDCLDEAVNTDREKTNAGFGTRKKKRQKSEFMIERLRAEIHKHPEASQKELAEILGISQGRVSQLKKFLA